MRAVGTPRDARSQTWPTPGVTQKLPRDATLKLSDTMLNLSFVILEKPSNKKERRH